MIPLKRSRESTPEVLTHFTMPASWEPTCKGEDCGQVGCPDGRTSHFESRPGMDPPVSSPTGRCCGSAESEEIRDEKFEELLTSHVIRRDLPFSYCESRSVREIFQFLGAKTQVSKETCAATAEKIYKRERENVKSLLTAVAGKINFTCDYWVCVNYDAYICLTAHFIDQDWNLKKKMVNFSIIPYPYEPSEVVEHVSNLISELGIARNPFSVIWDDDFPVNICDGVFPGVDYIPIRGAGVLNSIVRDGLKEMESSICKVRQVMQRVRGLPELKNKLLDCLDYYSLDPARGLQCDVHTSWYSTLSMLSRAVYYRSALMRLRTMDDEYASVVYPSEEEWDELEKFHDLVACVYSFTSKLLSAKHHPATASMFFPGMVSIYMAIKRAVGDGGHCPPLQGIASRILEKLNVFWKDCFSDLMAIAVVFDPRYKFGFVEFAMNKVYGDDGIVKCAKLKEKLYKLFEGYAKEQVSPVVPHHATSSFPRKQNGDSSWGDLMEEFGSHECRRSQLDQYLDEPRYDTMVDIDLLSYWKRNTFPYPQVAAMARDVLSIPISTAVLDAALDIKGKELGERWWRREPKVVEALICTKSWLSVEEDASKLDEFTPNILEDDSSSDSEDSTVHDSDSENDESDDAWV